jgi:hypothetical protein
VNTRPELYLYVVGATGFEPVTSSVSGHAHLFARSVPALHGTTSALLTRVTEPGTAVRREAAYGIAADKLLTVGRELHSIWRTSVRARRPMADRCSSVAPPPDRFFRGGGALHGADVRRLPGRTRPRQQPVSVMTRAQMRAGLDLLLIGALEQKAVANRQVIAICASDRLPASESPVCTRSRDWRD